MYLNLVQLAESFGVSETVVEGWIRDEGLPHTPDRGRLLFDRAQVAEWARTHRFCGACGSPTERRTDGVAAATPETRRTVSTADGSTSCSGAASAPPAMRMIVPVV